MFWEEKLPQAGKKQQRIGMKYFYLNTSYGLEYEKNWINKLSIKMFIKRKPEQERPMLTEYLWVSRRR